MPALYTDVRLLPQKYVCKQVLRLDYGIARILKTITIAIFIVQKRVHSISILTKFFDT